MSATKKWNSERVGWLLATLFGVGFSLVIMYLSYTIFMSDWRDNKEYKKDFYSRYSSSGESNNSFDKNFLTHRLIKADLDYGVSNKENANRALINVNEYLKAVTQSCVWENTDNGIANYVRCANKKLYDKFYYTQSVEVSNNYAVHRSDCDTNTYLMMDALKIKGIKGYAVFVPGHAFLAWKDSFDNFIYQETTWKNNGGKIADLSDSWYPKAIGNGYYIPASEALTESIYNALIYDVSKGRVNIDNIYKANKDNAFISDWYFYAKDKRNEITKDDVSYMLSSLHTDYTSTDKKMAIIHYLMRNGEKEKAISRLEKFPASKCGYDCFIANADLGRTGYIFFKSPFSMYDKFLKENSLSANLLSFSLGIFVFILSLILLSVTIIISRKSIKKIDAKNIAVKLLKDALEKVRNNKFSAEDAAIAICLLLEDKIGYAEKGYFRDDKKLLNLLSEKENAKP